MAVVLVQRKPPVPAAAVTFSASVADEEAAMDPTVQTPVSES